MNLNNLDWSKVSQFVEAVGIPFAVLLIFVGPFVWLAFTFLRKYAPRIADAHIAFMTSATETQAKNANTLAKLEETAAKDTQSHLATHHAIGLVAEAGLATLDGNHDQARQKLRRVEVVLDRKTG